MTKRRPATVGEILTEEFMQPMGLTQGAAAEAMNNPRERERTERAKPLGAAA